MFWAVIVSYSNELNFPLVYFEIPQAGLSPLHLNEMSFTSFHSTKFYVFDCWETSMVCYFVCYIVTLKLPCVFDVDEM